MTPAASRQQRGCSADGRSAARRDPLRSSRVPTGDIVTDAARRPRARARAKPRDAQLRCQGSQGRLFPVRCPRLTRVVEGARSSGRRRRWGMSRARRSDTCRGSGFALRSAADVRAASAARSTTSVPLPGVARVGLALTEGGGRRLRFVADREGDAADELDWCHIDAYDDVPLTAVVRDGEPVARRTSTSSRRSSPTWSPGSATRASAAMAAWPLPGTGLADRRHRAVLRRRRRPSPTRSGACSTRPPAASPRPCAGCASRSAAATATPPRTTSPGAGEGRPRAPAARERPPRPRRSAPVPARPAGRVERRRRRGRHRPALPLRAGDQRGRCTPRPARS